LWPQPQGSSLETGLCCPGPSSLNRPHPPHSQAHRDFTAERLIRNAFAVRERLGDPRVVPSFHWLFLPDMPSSASPGSSTSHCPISRCRRGLRHGLTGSTLPTSRNPIHAGLQFRGLRIHHCYGLSVCSPPRVGSDRDGYRRTGGFYIQAFGQVGHPSRRWI
jgi:hypothetical protein